MCSFPLLLRVVISICWLPLNPELSLVYAYGVWDALRSFVIKSIMTIKYHCYVSHWPAEALKKRIHFGVFLMFAHSFQAGNTRQE